MVLKISYYFDSKQIKSVGYLILICAAKSTFPPTPRENTESALSDVIFCNFGPFVRNSRSIW